MGKRTAGGQKKRFQDSLKVFLKSFNIDITSWETLAQDRPMWRSNTRQGAAEAQRKRAARKDKTHDTYIPKTDHMCLTCGRGFYARIGLFSHLRTHQRGATTQV